MTDTHLDFVSTWLASNAATLSALGFSQSKFSQIEAPAKLTVWYESADYLVDITAWELAASVDILVMSKTTKELSFSACGSCGNFKGLVDRLDSFLSWIGANVA